MTDASKTYGAADPAFTGTVEGSILNVINDYMDELKQLAVNVQFDKNQYFKYRFKPKLLCHDVYGNPELYYIILLLVLIGD